MTKSVKNIETSALVPSNQTAAAAPAVLAGAVEVVGEAEAWVVLFETVVVSDVAAALEGAEVAEVVGAAVVAGEHPPPEMHTWPAGQ